jgi:hypothetical protein
MDYAIGLIIFKADKIVDFVRRSVHSFFDDSANPTPFIEEKERAG